MGFLADLGKVIFSCVASTGPAVLGNPPVAFALPCEFEIH